MLGIRDVEDPADLLQCAQIQRDVWGCSTDDFIVTPSMLKVCLKSGGVVLGAFDGDGRIVGFTFSFPALWDGRVIQHSHMLAVLPAFRNAGVGYQLKLAQRKRFLGTVPLITWTFDPLESKNAHINLNRLGGVIRHYYRDLYGHHTASPLHEGIGTDRFLLELYLGETSESGICSKVEDADAIQLPRVIEVETRGDALVPVRVDTSLTAPLVLIEVPANIQDFKRKDGSAAAAWRQATREGFETYLGRGGEIRQLVRTHGSDPGQSRSFYLLAQGRQ